VEGPDEALPKARASVLRALELAPDLAEAHAQFAHIEGLFNLDWEASERAFQRALEFEPLALIFSANIGMIYYYARPIR
jgi:hypothetical protein